MNKNQKIAKELLHIAKMLVADKAKTHVQFFNDSDWKEVNEQYPIDKTDELFGQILNFIRNYQAYMDRYCADRRIIAVNLAAEAKKFVDTGKKLSQFDRINDLIQAQGMIEQWNVAAQSSNEYGNGQYNKFRDIPDLDNDATFDEESGLWIPSPDAKIVKSKKNWRDYITYFMKNYTPKFAPKFALFVERITASLPDETIDKIRHNFEEWGEGTVLSDPEFKAKIRFILSSHSGDYEVPKATSRIENVNGILTTRKTTPKFANTTRKFLADITNANGDLIAYASVDALAVREISQLGDQADDMVDTINEQIRKLKETHPKSKRKELEHVVDKDRLNPNESDFGEWDDDIDASYKNTRTMRASRRINAGFIDGVKSFWNKSKAVYDKVVNNVKEYKTKLLNFLRNVKTDMNECEQANAEAVNILIEGNAAMEEFINTVNKKAEELGYKG